MNMNTLGMPRQLSGKLGQHESTRDSSGQIVLHIFRANIKRSFRDWFLTGLVTATQGEQEYNADPKITIAMVPNDRSSFGT